MSEAILREDWLAPIELAFEKLKAANTAEREEVCEVVLLDYGSEAEAELKAKLAAHDQAMEAKLKVSGQEAVKVVKSTSTWRRELKPPAIKARALRDTLDVAMPEAAPIAPPKPFTAQLKLKPWSSIQIPRTANELEALTYVP